MSSLKSNRSAIESPAVNLPSLSSSSSSSSESEKDKPLDTGRQINNSPIVGSKGEVLDEQPEGGEGDNANDQSQVRDSQDT